MNNKLIITISIFTFLLLSCDNEDDNVHTDKSEFLVNKKWYPVSCSITPAYPIGSVNASTNYLLALGDCYLDSYLYFKTNGMGYFKGCWFDTDYDVLAITWSITQDEKALVETTESTHSSFYRIISLSEDRWISSYEFRVNYDVYTVIEEFEAKFEQEDIFVHEPEENPSTTEVEIVGTWAGIDEVGDSIKYVINNSTIEMEAAKSPILTVRADILINNVRHNYLVLKITFVSSSSESIDLYSKLTYTTYSIEETQIAIYDECNTLEEAESEISQVSNRHTVYKE